MQSNEISRIKSVSRSQEDVFVVYLTIYSGNRLPPLYIGSTSLKKYESGYIGSVSSQKYKSIWKQESKSNPDLFDVIVLEEFSNRKDAIAEELRLQKLHNVVKSGLFVNMALAAPNGSHGRDTSGVNHPLHGVPNCKGYKHWHHPITRERAFSIECPDGFVSGRLNDKANVNAGRRYCYNPMTSEYKLLHECPDGWVLKGPDSTLKGRIGSRKGKKNKNINQIKVEPFRSILKTLWIENGKCGSVNLIKYCHASGYNFVNSRTVVDTIIGEFKRE